MLNTTLAQTSARGVAEAAQIALVLVLGVTIALALLFLGCNLLLRAEPLAAPPAHGERRPSLEGAPEGTEGPI